MASNKKGDILMDAMLSGTIKNFIYGEWKYLSQVASIKTTFGDDGCLYYNDWETIGVDQVECIREQRKKKLIKIEKNENKKWFRK